MSPTQFEEHVMNFFKVIDPFAYATKPSLDGGIDGFAKHSNGKLMVVQCKLFSPSNSVGRPAIHQFRGAIDENEAWRGYFVTTSKFTSHARTAAGTFRKMILIEIDELVGWHKEPPNFH